MTRLLQFELKKIWTSTLFRALLLFFLIGIIFYYVYTYMNTVRIQDMTLEISERIHSTEQQIKDISGEGTGGSEEVDFWNEFNKKDQAERLAYETEDWHTVLEMQVESIRPDLDSLISSRQYYTYSFPTLFTEETRRASYRYMLEKQVTPILPVDRYAWRTIYDLHYPVDGVADDDFLKDFVEDHSTLNSSTGTYFLKQVSVILFGLPGVIFFLFLFSDIITKEGLGTNGSIQLLRTQPIRRHSIITTKFFVVLLLSSFILVGMALIALMLGTLFDQFGDFNYPILVYGEDYAFEFITMDTYLLKSVSLFSFVLLFSYALLFFFSYLTRRMILALGLTIATILVGIQLSKQAIGMGISHYLPFHYFSAPSIVNMEYAATINNFNFTYTTGLSVLSISSILIIAVTYVVANAENKW